MSRYEGRLPKTHAQAARMLWGRESRKVLNNTVLERGGSGRINVLYHGNLIASFSEDGSTVMTDSGYGTMSTRERLNAMAPAGVHFRQKNYVSQVSVQNGEQVKDTGTVQVLPDGTVHI